MVPEIWSVSDRIIYHFRPFFALSPPNNQKNQNFEKMKTTPGENHMMYGSCDMERDRRNFLSF